MVVIAIIVIIAAIAIPSARFLNKDRKIREAARVLSLFIDTAQVRASAKGSAGIMIERDSLNPRFGTRLYHVQIPPAYHGDFESAKAIIQREGLNQWYASFNRGDSSLIELLSKQNRLLGTKIRFGGRDPLFEIIDRNFTSDPNPPPLNYPGARIRVRFRIPVLQNSNPPRFYTTGGFPAVAVNGASAPVGYEVIQDPIPMKLSSSSIELPKGTRIDLRLSGIGPTGRQFAPFGPRVQNPNNSQPNFRPVIITFNEDRSINHVHYDLYNPSNSLAQSTYTGPLASPPASIYLFVVNEDGLDSWIAQNGTDFVEEELDEVNQYQNYLDTWFGNNMTLLDRFHLESPGNFWLTIGRANGAVSTADMVDSSGASNLDARISLSRRLAKAGHRKGGG